MVKFAQLPKYEAYKDSGVEWLGEIPAEWNLKKFKYLLDEINIRSVTGEETLLSLSKYHGVVPKSSLEDRSGGAATLIGYKRVSIGDLVINKMQAVNGLIAVSNEDGITSPDYSVYRSKGEDLLNINYLDYLLTQPEYLGEFNRRVTGVMEGFIRLYTDDLYNIQSVLPNINTQNIIVSFLDQKTAQIDAAIAIKEQQIELLKERKQIIIQQAVTQGLDPNVPMKDSGVEWIGQIPEHWEVAKLKKLIKRLESGVSVNASESESAEVDEIGVLKTSAVYKYRFDPNQNKKVFSSEVNRVTCHVKGGSIIISRMNAPDLVGASGYVEKDFPNLFLPDRLWQAIFHTEDKFLPQFVSKVLVTKGFRAVIESVATGSSPSMKNISKSDLLNVYIAIPPLNEITALVGFINMQDLDIEKAIALQLEQIQKLKEYKTTLINSAVTGKIKITPELLAK